MKILCVICQDQLSSSDDFFFTHCGHVFHHRCLLQWLERSKTCPQCRNRVTVEKIHKAHFTVSMESIADNVDNSTLQGRIDSLQFQILLNEKNIKYYTSKNIVLEKQNAGLRQEVRKVESEMRQKNSTIYALKEKINSFQQNYQQECDMLKRKLSQKEREVEKFQDMYKTLSTSTLEDVQGMVGKTTDHNTLINYIFMMKKIMLKKTKKIADLESQLTRHQHSLDKDLRFALCESKNLALQHRVNELEKLLTSENYISSSNNQSCSNSLITMQTANIYNQQKNIKQETAGQNNSSTSEAEIEIIETNQENSILNSTFDECPTVTKKARLSLQSGNNSKKTNDVNKDNIKNIAGISSQSNVKTSLKKKN